MADMTLPPDRQRKISDEDIPEFSWVQTGEYFTPEELAIINDAKAHERKTYIDEAGRGVSVTMSYKFHVRRFAKTRGLPSRRMIFEVDSAGQILISRWHLPGDKAVIDHEA